MTKSYAVQEDDPWNAAAEQDEVIDLSFYPTSLIARVASVLNQNHPAKNFGVTLPEWRLLGRLSVSSPIQFAVLCRVANFDKAQAGRVLRGLEKRGLVQVRIDPAHSSRRIVTITPEGLAFTGKVMPYALEKQKELLRVLSHDERKTTFEVLCKLLEAYDVELPGPAASYREEQ